jgi:hypothetical protein
MARPRLFNDREKWCNKCKAWLPLAAFSANRSTPSGKEWYCKSCATKCDKEYGQKPEVRAHLCEYFRWWTYRITKEQHITLWESQGRACAICKKPIDRTGKKTHIDHDHACCAGDRSCGKCIRGLLCDNCNHALGMFQDSATVLQEAMTYLAKGPLSRPKVEDSRATTCRTPHCSNIISTRIRLHLRQLRPGR